MGHPVGNDAERQQLQAKNTRDGLLKVGKHEYMSTERQLAFALRCDILH
jgi:hypothetical protein